MKFDILGRISNMRLPDGKTAILYSVYEAVSNSIHSINDRFGVENAAQKGVIDVSIDLDDNSDISSISVTDNGVGFTEENLTSFETSDSRYKYVRGGKGVGRFIWIKMFHTIRVDSVTGNGKDRHRVRFRFAPEKSNSIAYKHVASAVNEKLRTTVTLSKLRSEQKGRVRPSSYLKDLALHFFPQFVAGTLPRIQIAYDGEISSLNEFIAGKVSPPNEITANLNIEGTEAAFTIDHLFVDTSISSNLRNSYLLTAHGRLVGDPVSIEQKYSLRDLPDNKAYVSVVRSNFLNERVDQERLGFKLTVDQRQIIDDFILQSAEVFLKDHIHELRGHQRKTVEGLLQEHPQLATQFSNLDDYVSTLPPGMNDEQIAQNLFVLLYRDERDLRRRVEKLDHLKSLDEQARKEAEETLEDLENQEKHRLAELVVKRHQVLQLANVLLKFKDADKKSYHFERAIHDLICPMREIYKSGDYDKHNLWIVDDSLATYQFFASDKPISSFAAPSVSTKEPDLIFFNPLGFRRQGTDDPVVIVEFKRPGDDSPSQDPVQQVLNYIDELRSNTVHDVDGQVVTDVTEETPFECIVVCELTEKTRKLLGRSLAQHLTPDGQGYYGWSTTHNAHIRVMSFSKMLRDAELRNKVFFDQLKLGSPSFAAKRRAARNRQRVSPQVVATAQRV